ncbi:(2Fe-2S)-binding protein [Svornostia abyssi]|uniref:(2Fe-2S)-binding protein n=1 Tax=Svornostia abyssi TaxID=2898438 RepID=A0ABY5PP65_9ACTN|nr:(2Fe-2S)-binding protein [Parviterribacteraceae bacterium J379]
MPADLPPGVFAAGQVLGHDGPDAAELSGAIAGADAAHELGLGDDASRARLAEDVSALRGASLGIPSAPPPAPQEDERGRCIVCLCEDVTTKDLKIAVAEGFDEIELAKRYTTATMGPCQGRMCQRAVNQVLSDETRRPPSAVGLTTARPPWTTVPLGVLAGRPYQPGEALAPAHAPPGGRRADRMGRRLAPGLRLRRRRRGGHRRARRLRRHRRVLAGQAARARARRRGLPRPHLPEPHEHAGTRSHPLRRAHRRGRTDHRRRHGRATGRRHLLRDDHVLGRRRHLRVAALVAGRLADGRTHHRRHPGAQRREPGGPARPGGPHRAGPGARLLGRGIRVPRRAARGRRRRRGAGAAHRVRRGARLRVARRQRARGDPLGRAHHRGRATVRPGAPAGAAPPEGPPDHRRGHRRGDHPGDGRHGLRGEARQGRGVRGQVGARAPGLP